MCHRVGPINLDSHLLDLVDTVALTLTPSLLPYLQPAQIPKASILAA